METIIMDIKSKSKSNGRVNIRSQFILGAHNIDTTDKEAISKAQSEVDLFRFFCDVWYKENIQVKDANGNVINISDSKKIIPLIQLLRQGYKLTKPAK